MERVNILYYTLIGLMFLLALSANLSTDYVRRRRLYISYLVVGLLFFGMLATSIFTTGSIETSLITYSLFCGIALIWPQLISRILIRQKINHPVVFLKKKTSLIATLVAFLIFASLPSVALPAHTYNFAEGKAIYDEFYVLSSVTFMLFYIPLIILAIQFLVERTAICENGLYQTGLLSNWSNFKSYAWPQGEIYADPDVQPFLHKNTLIDLVIEPKIKSFGTTIRLTIPLDEKIAIDSLLSRKINKVQNTVQQSHPRTTTA